jgi:hypothetical protein
MSVDLLARSDAVQFVVIREHLLYSHIFVKRSGSARVAHIASQLIHCRRRPRTPDAGAEFSHIGVLTYYGRGHLAIRLFLNEFPDGLELGSRDTLLCFTLFGLGNAT